MHSQANRGGEDLEGEGMMCAKNLRREGGRRHLRRHKGLNGIQSLGGGISLGQEEKGWRGQFADGGRGVLRIGRGSGVTGDTSILVPHSPHTMLTLLQPHLPPGCSSSISAHSLLP